MISIFLVPCLRDKCESSMSASAGGVNGEITVRDFVSMKSTWIITNAIKAHTERLIGLGKNRTKTFGVTGSLQIFCFPSKAKS